MFMGRSKAGEAGLPVSFRTVAAQHQDFRLKKRNTVAQEQQNAAFFVGTVPGLTDFGNTDEHRSGCAAHR
jgi:hypothetical protein